jgi:hypothetical protein
MTAFGRKQPARWMIFQVVERPLSGKAGIHRLRILVRWVLAEMMGYLFDKQVLLKQSKPSMDAGDLRD